MKRTEIQGAGVKILSHQPLAMPGEPAGLSHLAERVRLHHEAMKRNRETPECIKRDAAKACDEFERARRMT